MNPLPLDCEAFFQDDFLSTEQADALFDEIVSGFDVTNKRIPMHDGTEFINETGSYLFADRELTSFDTLPAVWGARSQWTPSLEQVRDRIFSETRTCFQVARCVYYRDGSEGMEFHSDPPAYGSTARIASLSLGAEREFVFRKTAAPEEQFSVRLTSGSLLLMGAGCQETYEHGLPRDDRCREPRLNITFRMYGFDG
ncbi:alpha-ketoglutarate-dependent dioxygenase AlkB [Stieleria varia]|uniref:2OG-Fe(II) oxygenase superfamily protein n=1 Tax=Stieleria varia TaxID=2528005 RepID=A0A5C5ZWT5_9BACT|nr:alpha-ketoglutarate-dependent dioxygenase AlkB [Stieleria varia]TWT92074.1 2OG-Fe(II) oxygenase superfamily protein [Stieleria varia]